MKATAVLCISSACLLLAGCAKTRSISNSGFHGQYEPSPGLAYPELNEFDVLGIESAASVSEEQIQEALNAGRLQLRPGSAVLLIQSGAVFPDGALVKALGGHFRVVPLSGVRERPKEPGARWHRTTPADVTLSSTRARSKSGESDKAVYAKTLRLVAARAGCESIICCWGILESANEPLPTNTVSWIPVVNWLAPDERQHTRIRLKVAAIDVRTGAWTVVSPETIEDKTWSTRPRREVADQKQVERLKREAYELAAQQLAGRFTP